MNLLKKLFLALKVFISLFFNHKFLMGLLLKAGKIICLFVWQYFFE